ncbi:MAG: cysteine synthase family protein, partial [Lachnospiraceae bacterium]|nr:cysteine synthase family protein [Lachnospiraceae bacterium]
MAKIYHSITELIGNTPVIELHRYEKEIGTGAHILAKLEFFNPLGSVKDRIALNMIEAKEESGELKEGGTIIEGTSGNTGIALAAIGAAKGYAVKIAMPDNLSVEWSKLIKAFGGEVVYTPGVENMAGAGKKASELNEEIPGSVVIGQGGNPNNPGAHYKTTGEEIWQDLDGKVDIFVSAAGTGGTISGAGKLLKERKPDVRIVAVEPKNSAL